MDGCGTVFRVCFLSAFTGIMVEWRFKKKWRWDKQSGSELYLIVCSEKVERGKSWKAEKIGICRKRIGENKKVDCLV